MDSIIDIKDSKDFTGIGDVKLEISNVRIGASAIHGRGVFATKNFIMNEVVERFPIVPLAFRLRYQGDPMLLSTALIHTTCPCDDCKKHGWSMFLQGGNGMFYNHQDSNNSIIKVNWELLYGEILTQKVIKEGEEITINYGKNYPWGMTGMEKVTIESSQ